MKSTLGIDINSKDSSGDTPLLKLCRVYQVCKHEIHKRFAILIEYEASLKAKNNDGIDAMQFLIDNNLLFEADLEEYRRPNKKRRVLR